MRRLFWLAIGITIGALVVRKLSRAADLVELLAQNLPEYEVRARIDPDQLQLQLIHEAMQLVFPIRVLCKVALEQFESGVTRGGNIAHRLFSRPVRKIEEIFDARYPSRVADDAAPCVRLIRKLHFRTPWSLHRHG